MCDLSLFTNFVRNISHSKKKNIGPIFKGQEFQEEKKALENGTDRFSWKLYKGLSLYAV
jgi:hypothetical protein